MNLIKVYGKIMIRNSECLNDENLRWIRRWIENELTGAPSNHGPGWKSKPNTLCQTKKTLQFRLRMMDGQASKSNMGYTYFLP